MSVSKTTMLSTRSLRENGGCLGHVLDAIPDGILIADSEGRVVFVNGQLAEMVGTPEAALVGKSFEHLIDDGPEAHLLCRDGRRLPVEVRLCPVELEGNSHTLAVVRDGTGRRQLEQRLQHTEEQARAVFEDGPVGMLMIDAEDRITMANRAIASLLGCTKADLVGRDFKTLLQPDERSRAGERIQRLFRGELASYRVEVTLLRSDGAKRLGLVTATAVRDETGRPIAAVGTIEDITVSKALEQELAHQASQAREVLSRLTAREIEVLELAGEGLVARQIAARLFVSVRTVESHLANAYRKLAVNDKQEATDRFVHLRGAAGFSHTCQHSEY